jgi:hypothetical protein
MEKTKTCSWVPTGLENKDDCVVRVRVRVTLRLAVYRQSVRLGDKPLETHDKYFFSTEHLGLQSLCNILSDMRMGLSFTIAAGPRQRSKFLGPSLAGLVTIFYCLRFETPPNWRSMSPYFYPPRTGWLGCTPIYWVPFSSPPTIPRVKAEVFEPASTRDISDCAGEAQQQFTGLAIAITVTLRKLLP